MGKIVVEGMEIEKDDLAQGWASSGNSRVMRLGPINVTLELREVIEELAEEEQRSVSSTCVMLMKEALVARNKRAKIRKL